MTVILHKHHIKPKHMGGTDDSSNLIELTIEEHAKAHQNLYEKYGKHEDYIAWKALSGQMSNCDIQLEKCRLGGKIASQKNIGSKRTPEQRLNISQSRLGYIRSEASKIKQSITISGINNPFYGKTHTNEFKLKQSKNKKLSYVGAGNPKAKSIHYNGITYGTMKEMSVATGISLYKIRKMQDSIGA